MSENHQDVEQLAAIFSGGIDAHLGVIHLMPVLKDAFVAAVGLCDEAIRQGGKILLFGNGGSAADAQHIAAEFSIRFVKNRPAIAALAVTTDTSALTAAGNDFGFDQIFSRQIEALARAGDVAIGFSTSGRSPNVLRGLDQAKKAGAKTIGFCGHNESEMGKRCDVVLAVPSSVTARIQEMHILLGHLLCEGVERDYESK